MKLRLPTCFALWIAAFAPVAFSAEAKNCGCECCKGKEVCCCHADEAKAEAVPANFHPLSGLVMNVMAEKQALVVKHEEIPGVMRAMTMMFLVEPDVLAKVNKGDAIKALMGRDENNKWVLRQVQVVAAAK